MTDHNAGMNGALAAELRAEAKAKRMTQAEIAKRSGIPPVSVQRYLDAKRGMSLPIVEQLATALGMTTIEALTRADARLNPPPAGGAESQEA